MQHFFFVLQKSERLYGECISSITRLWIATVINEFLRSYFVTLDTKSHRRALITILFKKFEFE